MIEFENGAYGVALNLEEGRGGRMFLGEPGMISGGDHREIDRSYPVGSGIDHRDQSGW